MAYVGETFEQSADNPKFVALVVGEHRQALGRERQEEPLVGPVELVRQIKFEHERVNDLLEVVCH